MYMHVYMYVYMYITVTFGEHRPIMQCICIEHCNCKSLILWLSQVSVWKLGVYMYMYTPYDKLSKRNAIYYIVHFNRYIY